MSRYGQTLISWGTTAAPQIATGNVTSYSLRDAATRQLIDDMTASYVASILHSRKGALQWAARVTSGSTNWLDLSVGADIAVSTISTGIVLASKAVESWRVGQAKTIAADATWYPALTQTSPVAAGITNSAFTPTQSALSILTPSASLIYGTLGMTHAAGILQAVTLTQSLELFEDEVDPTGDILGVQTGHYMRELELEILGKAAAPAVGATLTLTDGPAMTVDFQIESVEPKLTEHRGTLYSVKAFWIAPFSS